MVLIQGMVTAFIRIQAPGRGFQPFVMGTDVVAVVQPGSAQFQNGEQGTGQIEAEKYGG
ncbi:hypothetical protein D3C87_2191190 [compost metagenome]